MNDQQRQELFRFARDVVIWTVPMGVITAFLTYEPNAGNPKVPAAVAVASSSPRSTVNHDDPHTPTNSSGARAITDVDDATPRRTPSMAVDEFAPKESRNTNRAPEKGPKAKHRSQGTSVGQPPAVKPKHDRAPKFASRSEGLRRQLISDEIGNGLHSLSAHNYRDAISHFLSASSSAPKDPLPEFLLALAHRRAGRETLAEERLANAIGLETVNRIPNEVWSRVFERIQGRDRKWLEDARLSALINAATDSFSSRRN